ncbi:hypothetical protein EGT74_03340 [Chitinophaga lutea]|uniref:Uncharacterized protein n=1 Tax=Chitinophaga lutea TaxID=2488634 RepID=A0A3N4PXF2_9BACT|nr:hypothetical protein [Chitinophaga lutea]RPE12598.1 hypothetical protein EGT74_03340 [Chitinophaga lutea]
MQKIGSFLIILGLLSIVATYFDRVPKILAWIYQWGDNTAWAIKIGVIVLGVVLYLAGGKKQRA